MEGAHRRWQLDLGGSSRTRPSAPLPLILLTLLLGWGAVTARADQTFAVALPEQEGPVTLGIFASSGESVRILYRDAPVESLPAGLNGLLISWDGRDDSGRDLPPGEYEVRGLVHGPVRADLFPESAAMSPGEAWPGSCCGAPPTDPSATMILPAPKDELYDARPLVTFRIGNDGTNGLLEADGLPLAGFPLPSGTAPPASSLVPANAAPSMTLSHGPDAGSAVVTLSLPAVTGSPEILRWRIGGLDRVVPLHPGKLRLPATPASSPEKP